MLKVAVITISDRAFRGEYADLSGPAVRDVLLQSAPETQIIMETVPDEKRKITQALEKHLDCDWILTTGGTGISPRDVTPEATRGICDRELPGVSEWLRRESQAETPFAVFSRGTCGINGDTIIVNLPGSVRGARFCARLLSTVLKHGVDMIRGAGH